MWTGGGDGERHSKLRDPQGLAGARLPQRSDTLVATQTAGDQTYFYAELPVTQRVAARTAPRRIALPGYAMARTRYWFDRLIAARTEAPARTESPVPTEAPVSIETASTCRPIPRNPP